MSDNDEFGLALLDEVGDVLESELDDLRLLGLHHTVHQPITKQHDMRAERPNHIQQGMTKTTMHNKPNMLSHVIPAQAPGRQSHVWRPHTSAPSSDDESPDGSDSTDGTDLLLACTTHIDEKC